MLFSRRLRARWQTGWEPPPFPAVKSIDRFPRRPDVRAPMTDKTSDALVPAEGLHVLHLFYKIERGSWSLLDPDEQRAAKIRLSELVQEIRATSDTQLLIFSMVSPK